MASKCARTNLKVGGWHAGKKIFVVPLHFFGSNSTISRFGERVHDGQYSLVSFFFAVLLLMVPPVPFVKVGGTRAPPCPMESMPLVVAIGLRA